MSAWTPEVRGRFARVANGESWLDRGAWEQDARLALAHIDALEARVAVLAARIDAIVAHEAQANSAHRWCSPTGGCVVCDAAVARRAAGALEGGSS